MRNYATKIENLLKRVKSFFPGVMLSILFYSDMYDDPPLRFADFLPAGDPVDTSMRIKNGGDMDEAQRYALTCSMNLLAWRRDSTKFIFHITDAAPHHDNTHTNEEQYEIEKRAIENLRFSPDWLAICRNLNRMRIGVHTFLIKDDSFLSATPYHAAMGALTSVQGVYVVERDWNSVFKQIQAVLTNVVAQYLPVVRFSGASIDRLHETPDEQNAGELLSNCWELRADRPSIDVSITLSKTFKDLVRLDAKNKRFRSTPRKYEMRLRESAQKIRDRLKNAPRDSDTIDSISASTLSEAVDEFCSSELPEDMTELFMAMSSLVMGPTFFSPYGSKKGRFNYESSFGVRVFAVRTGYRLSYNGFLDYDQIKRGANTYRNRRYLHQGIDDLVLRSDGKITGVLPVLSDDSVLAKEVYSSLASSPWLDAITWHSVCRHVFPPPKATTGFLANALLCAAFDSTVGQDTLRLIVDSIRIIGDKLTPGSSPAETVASVCFSRTWENTTEAVYAYRKNASGEEVKKAVERIASATGHSVVFDESEDRSFEHVTSSRISTPIINNVKKTERRLVKIATKLLISEPDSVEITLTPDVTEDATVKLFGKAVVGYVDNKWSLVSLGESTKVWESRGGRMLKRWPEYVVNVINKSN